MNSGNYEWHAFICGMFLGAFTLAILLLTPWSYHYKAVKAIEECEKSLPRDQECKLVGIVITNDK